MEMGLARTRSMAFWRRAWRLAAFSCSQFTRGASKPQGYHSCHLTNTEFGLWNRMPPGRFHLRGRIVDSPSRSCFSQSRQYMRDSSLSAGFCHFARTGTFSGSGRNVWMAYRMASGQWECSWEGSFVLFPDLSFAHLYEESALIVWMQCEATKKRGDPFLFVKGWSRRGSTWKYWAHLNRPGWTSLTASWPRTLCSASSM